MRSGFHISIPGLLEASHAWELAADTSIFVVAPCRPVALRTKWLIHQMARPSLRKAMLLLCMVNRTAPSFRAKSLFTI